MYPTRYASFLKRLVAYIVDSLVSGMIAGALFIPLLIIFIPKTLADMTLTQFLSGHGHHLFNPEDIGISLAPIIANIVMFVLLFCLIRILYFALFESSPRQATPGKMLLGLFVTDLGGRRISFGRALGRNLGRILSKMCCYLGYFLALFSSQSQALHDMLAGTLVLEPLTPGPEVSQPAPPADIPGA